MVSCASGKPSGGNPREAQRPSPETAATAAKARVGHRCILGRETCLQRVAWNKNGWLRLAPPPGGMAAGKISRPGCTMSPQPPPPGSGTRTISRRINSVCVTVLIAGSGGGRVVNRCKNGAAGCALCGRDSLHSLFEQSLVARRVKSISNLPRKPVLRFSPDHFTQLAGLVCCL